MKRVVVTGIGIVAPGGVGKEAYWGNILSGRSFSRRDPDIEALGLGSKVLCRADDFRLEDHFEGREHEEMLAQDRFVQMGVAAGKMAIEEAGLASGAPHPEDAGVIFSSTAGGYRMASELFELLTDKGEHAARYREIDERFYNAATYSYPGTLLMRRYGFQGVTTALSTGCTAGLDALGLCFELVHTGDASIMVAGVSEAPLTPLMYALLTSLGCLSTVDCEPEKASRPFDARRMGFVIGEASAALVLEDLDHALARGAPILAEVLGYASLNSAFHMFDLQEHGKPMARAIEAVLASAGVGRDEIDYINPHGTSTPQNDLFETNAIKLVFGERAHRVPISSTKSMVGHALAASNLLGAIATIGGMRRSMIPPTINHEVPDPKCDLDYVPNHARPGDIRTALVISSGFGGLHSAAIFRKHEGST